MLTDVYVQSQILSRLVVVNTTQPYEPSQFAILQLCDRFRHTVGKTTKLYGKQTSHHQCHLIAEPIRSLLSLSPFRKSSPRFWRFQQFVSRLNEAGIGDYLWRQWNEKASIQNFKIQTQFVEKFRYPVSIINASAPWTPH